MKHYGTMHVPTASSISYAIDTLAERVPSGADKLELVLNLERQTIHVIGRDPEESWDEREKRQATTAPLTPTRRGQRERDSFHREQVNREKSRISLRRADREAMQTESAAAHPPATAAPASPSSREDLPPHPTPPSLASRILSRLRLAV